MDNGLYAKARLSAVHKITEIGMELDVLRENKVLAHRNLHHLQDHGVKSVDVMGSIGAGKTSLIIRLAEKLIAKGLRVAAVAGDVTGADDFGRMEAAGIVSVNCNTGKECHLDAHMVEHALEDLDLDSVDVLFIENVGNLVCPADFPLGTDHRMVVISVTEGDDMVRKHPDIFLHSDLAVLNKVDIAPHVDMDVSRVVKDYASIRPDSKIHCVSVKTDEGLDELIADLGL